MARGRRLRREGVCLAVILAASCACSPTVPSAAALATLEAVSSQELDPAIADAMRFRRAAGLRADEEWVRLVAANPAAVGGLETYEFALLPDEVAYLNGRLQRIEDALAFGQSFGAEFPDGFAGATIDTTAGDRLVLMYTKDVEIHRLRLALATAGIRPDVRHARWTLAELEQFRAQVNARPFPDPHLKIYGADIDVLANRVRVNFGAPRRDSGDVLPAHYGSTGWLVPRWNGPFEPDNRPTGALVVTVVDATGAPLRDLPCRYTSSDPNLYGEGGGDTSRAGRCTFTEVAVGQYRIDILSRDERVDRLLASVDVDVIAGATHEVTIVIDQ